MGIKERRGNLFPCAFPTDIDAIERENDKETEREKRDGERETREGEREESPCAFQI